MPTPRVAVLPQRRQPSWPKRDYAEPLPTGPLVDVLERTWPHNEALATAYTHIGAPSWPRYSVGITAHPEHSSVYLTCCFVDLDRTPHKPWPAQGAAADAVGRLRPLFPSAGIYATRAGVRLVWVLQRPVPIRWARWWLQSYVLGDVGGVELPRGLELDRSCAEWTRAFLLPRVLRDGVILDLPMDLAPLHQGTRITYWPPGEPEVEIREDRQSYSSGDQPDAIPEAPDGWDAWVSGRSKVGEVLGLLRDRRPWGPPEVAVGTRNSSLKTAVNSLAAQLWRGRKDVLTASQLYAIFAPSVALAASTDPGAPPLAKLWQFCDYSASRQDESRAYLDDPGDPQYPRVLVQGSTYWVREGGASTYAGPIRGPALFPTLAELQPEVPTTSASGNTHSVNRIMQHHGARAMVARTTYPGVDFAPWDLTTRTVTQLAFPAPSCSAEQDPEVEGWLDALLPPTLRGTVLDWLATAPRLHQPTAALYLQGEPGIGKGMLVAALAQLWRGSPSSFDSVVNGDYNDALLQSPIVQLDEGTSLNQRGSARFRSLVAESQHSIRTKYIADRVLLGCPRVVITANNGRALALNRAGRSAEDLQAITQRILHVPLRAAGRSFLRSLGGRRYTEATGWVTGPQGAPGRVTRHLAYLAAHRDVIEGQRFLVEGILTRYHVNLITADALYGQLLIAIAGALAPAATSTTPSGGVGVFCLGDGRVRVNPRALHSRWHSLTVEDVPKPRLQEVAEGLGSLSKASESEEWALDSVRSTYWPVDGSLVLQTAQDLGYPDVRRIRESLALGTPNAPAQPDTEPVH